jgi:actin-related protein
MTNIILYTNNKNIYIIFENQDSYTEYRYKLNDKYDFMGNLTSLIINNNLFFSNKNVLIIDQNNNLRYRKDIGEIMFKLLNVSAFYITSQSLLSLIENDINSGLVIDYYNNNIHMIPIENNNIIKNEIFILENNNSFISNIDKLINQFEYTDVIYSTNVPKKIIEKIDNFKGDIILGDPINGAKKFISYLDNNNWITKEKFNEKGVYIIEKKCQN